jgi:hypothetical protein
MDVEHIETLGSWTVHIEAMDKALAANDTGGSLRAWRRAYSFALSHPGWLGLFTVATPALRVGRFPSLARDAAALARETYWIAFFRARQQRSFTGVLRTGEAFAMLGDSDSANRCLRFAEMLDSSMSAAAEIDRVRLPAPRLGQRDGSERAERCRLA